MLNGGQEILNGGGVIQLAYSNVADNVLFNANHNKLVYKFTQAVRDTGGEVIPVKTIADIRYHLLRGMDHDARNITNIPLLYDIMESIENKHFNPRPLQDVDNVVIEARFAVAENGAVWVTEDVVALRTLPFSCQHLAVIVNAKDIVSTMHEADAQVNNAKHASGCLISGPAKRPGVEPLSEGGTARQRRVTVFLMG